ncbi:hypothetical protein Droror1_Dr00010255 [Drosera rotundifolia]
MKMKINKKEMMKRLIHRLKRFLIGPLSWLTNSMMDWSMMDWQTNKDITISNEVYSLEAVDFDREEFTCPSSVFSFGSHFRVLIGGLINSQLGNYRFKWICS